MPRRYGKMVPIGLVAENILKRLTPPQGDELAKKAGSGPDELGGELAEKIEPGKHPKVH